MQRLTGCSFAIDIFNYTKKSSTIVRFSQNMSYLNPKAWEFMILGQKLGKCILCLEILLPKFLAIFLSGMPLGNQTKLFF